MLAEVLQDKPVVSPVESRLVNLADVMFEEGTLALRAAHWVFMLQAATQHAVAACNIM
jgi:hypothetical protein